MSSTAARPVHILSALRAVDVAKSRRVQCLVPSQDTRMKFGFAESIALNARRRNVKMRSAEKPAGVSQIVAVTVNIQHAKVAVSATKGLSRSLQMWFTICARNVSILTSDRILQCKEIEKIGSMQCALLIPVVRKRQM
jgi:hypothetical protein